MWSAMLRRSWVVVTLSIMVVVAVGLVATSFARGGPVRARSEAVSTSIHWRSCTEDEIPSDPSARATLQCARVVVPVDYERPQGRTLSLFVSRRPALGGGSLGPLFVNQGGPGKQAALYPLTFSSYPAFDRFDIIGMDPRGVNLSTQLECRSDIREVPAVSVSDPGKPKTRFEDAVETFAKGCARDPNLPYFGSNNAARDMDRIRELLGADKITYYGKSYGSDLGTAYLSLFPDRVRAAALDGASDLTLDAVDFITQQGRAGQRGWDRYLEHCRVDGCAWTRGKDPEVAWFALLHRLDVRPVKDPESGDRLTDGDLRDFAYASIGLPARDIDAVLDALVLEKDASAFSSSVDDEAAREAEAFVAITCLDIPVNEFRAALERLQSALGEPSPDLIATLAFCGAWPKPADPITVRPVPAGIPVVVVSTRGDVPTPYESGVGLARALAVPVLTWEANAHTAYLLSPCVQQHVNDLLVDLKPLPAQGAVCPVDDRPVEVPLPPLDEPDLVDG